MKRRDLVKLFNGNGWYLKREGGDHTIFEKVLDNGQIVTEQIPRHREINEKLARYLIKKWNLK